MGGCIRIPYDSSLWHNLEIDMSRQVLIATLGSEPQVVTLGLDLLEKGGQVISEVIVLHTVGKVAMSALQRLREEFASGGALKFRSVEVEDEGRPVADIVTEQDMAALLRTTYRTVLSEKRAGRSVHMSIITGGRKPMAVGMVVAQLLFDEDDRVWHLLTEGWRPGDERTLYLRSRDRVYLVPVPVLRWSSVSPVLTELALREDPWEAVQVQNGMKQETSR